MGKIKKAYYYLFYKIYKSIEYTSESLGGSFWTDFKAGLVILTLELFIWMAFLNYYSIINKISFNLSVMSPILLPLILFCILNYIFLMHTDKWKEYNKEFDQLPIEKNKKGGIIVWCTVALIVINLFFSYYLLLMRAKRNQTGPYSKEYIQQQKAKDSISDAKYKMDHQ
ncbi:hypothetical protein N0B40_07745 [Chryseobacterium oranimense]|uniref:hypothetical protein n=1 Tax=Chryseobacterium oranimense TaxID=421058 RepID=UPI0021AF3AC7|nr:hypothetical protein [Chryseobacterium oranimense]UWX62174.1 hypothetical protein N0B40_07745 [Chryseobacterium oranimense]